MELQIEGVTVELGGVLICRDVSLQVPGGAVVGLVGPNGSGKTTLLRTVYRVLRPRLGRIVVGGDDVWTLSPRDSAQRTAVVVQEPAHDFEFSVSAVVAMGRTPHKRAFERDSDNDQFLVSDALHRVGLAALANRPFGTLSGGEKQRALIARSLAQQAKVLVLDEPTNHLDLRYQLETLRLIKSLGVTTIMAIHDVNLASQFCDQVVLMRQGAVQTAGETSTVLTESAIQELFEVDVEVATTTSGRRTFWFGPNAPGAVSSRGVGDSERNSSR